MARRSTKNSLISIQRQNRFVAFELLLGTGQARKLALLGKSGFHSKHYRRLDFAVPH